MSRAASRRGFSRGGFIHSILYFVALGALVVLVVATFELSRNFSNLESIVCSPAQNRDVSSNNIIVLRTGSKEGPQNEQTIIKSEGGSCSEEGNETHRALLENLEIASLPVYTDSDSPVGRCYSEVCAARSAEEMLVEDRLVKMVMDPKNQMDQQKAAELLHSSRTLLFIHLNASGLFVSGRNETLNHPHVLLNGLGRLPYTYNAALRHFHHQLIRPNGRKSYSFFLNVNAGSIDKPVFSFCKFKHHIDLLLPRTYMGLPAMPADFYPARKKGQRVEARRIDRFENSKNIFEKKPTAVFRGALTNARRIDLALMTKYDKNVTSVGGRLLVDAGIMDYRSEEEFQKLVRKGTELPPVAEELNIQEQLDEYRYIISVDGWACADRLPMLLRSEAVVLKQTSDFSEYWYSSLKPYVDFWPLRKDLLDAREDVAYLNKNPLLAKEMGVAGASTVNTYVNFEKVNCYVIKVVEGYQHIFLEEIDIEGLGLNVVEIEAKLL